MKNIAEVRKLTEDELKADLLMLRKQQFNLRIQKVNGSLDKTHEFKHLRKAIARVKTILIQKAGNGND